MPQLEIIGLLPSLLVPAFLLWLSPKLKNDIPNMVRRLLIRAEGEINILKIAQEIKDDDLRNGKNVDKFKIYINKSKEEFNKLSFDESET